MNTFKMLKSISDGIVDFVSLIPTALQSGAASTMEAHGRDLTVRGLEVASGGFGNADDSLEMISFHQACAGQTPIDLEHAVRFNGITQANRLHFGNAHC